MVDHVDCEDQVLLRVLLSQSRTVTSSTFGYHELISKYINEPGVYSLVFKSRLPAAREFSRFVKKEVLPNLRRQVQARSIAEVERLRIEHAQELERRNQTIVELQRQRLALATEAERVNDDSMERQIPRVVRAPRARAFANPWP